MMKKYKIKSFLNYFFIFITFLCIETFSSCCIFEDCPDDVEIGELGDTLWIHDRISGTYYMGGSLALGEDGSIYYSFSGGQSTWEQVRIAAVDKSDGSLKWMTEYLDHIGLSSHIVVGDDGTIYAIGYYTLYAIDPSSGAFKWTWEVPHTLPLPDGGEFNSYGQIGGLALLGNGNLVLVSGGSGVHARVMFCVDTNGSRLWYNPDAVAWGVNGNLVVGANNKVFYYENNYIKSVDGVSGQILWTKKIVSQGSAANNIAFNDNGELICSFIEEGGTQYKLYRIDPGNGAILWKSTDESSSSGLLLSPTGQVAQFIGNMYLIDLITGTSKVFNPDGSQLPLAINNNNQYVIPSIQSWANPRCGFFNEDGSLDWNFRTIGMTGNIVIGDNKVMYFTSNIGKIIAIQGDAVLANSGWPKNGHDNRNTFNYSKQ